MQQGGGEWERPGYGGSGPQRRRSIFDIFNI
jgi:hypothetical protein